MSRCPVNQARQDGGRSTITLAVQDHSRWHTRSDPETTCEPGEVTRRIVSIAHGTTHAMFASRSQALEFLLHLCKRLRGEDGHCEHEEPGGSRAVAVRYCGVDLIQ